MPCARPQEEPHPGPAAPQKDQVLLAENPKAEACLHSFIHQTPTGHYSQLCAGTQGQGSQAGLRGLELALCTSPLLNASAQNPPRLWAGSSPPRSQVL